MNELAEPKQECSWCFYLMKFSHFHEIFYNKMFVYNYFYSGLNV